MPETVVLDTPDGEMGLYDTGGSAQAAVVVVQEAFGVNDHIEDVTRRFAEAGYRAVSPHLFYRSGDPRLGYDDVSQVMPHMQAVTKEGLTSDMDATLAYLDKAGFPLEKVGIVGFCMGGSVTFWSAAEYSLGAAVTFYGGGISTGRFGVDPHLELASKLKTPWLGLYGDLDRGIPVEEVEALRKAVESAPVETEIVRYAEAEHGFHCDARDSFHQASSKDAWARTLAWFSAHL
jgi:carboxymethylenebutenolidase